MFPKYIFQSLRRSWNKQIHFSFDNFIEKLNYNFIFDEFFYFLTRILGSIIIDVEDDLESYPRRRKKSDKWECNYIYYFYRSEIKNIPIFATNV